MFVDRCSSLVPLLSGCSAEAEELRRVPEPVIERAHEINLFAAVVPTSLGGDGEDLAAIASMMDAAARDAVDMDVRVEARLAAAATVRASRRIITHVCDGAGAGVYTSDHPLQRIQRDVETLKGHVIFDWDRTAEMARKHALGIPLPEHAMV